MPPSIPRKPIKPENNAKNQTNPNRGTDGTNPQYDQAQGNRGKQIQQEMLKKAQEQAK